MSKFDLYGGKTLPDARTRSVVAGIPGTADVNNLQFKILPELRAVSSMFESMAALPLSDAQDVASIEVPSDVSGQFLATCALNKRENWNGLYAQVAGASAGRVGGNAFLSAAVAAEQAKASMAVDRFIESVAPAAQGNSVYEVSVRGEIVCDTPSSTSYYDEDSDTEQYIAPTVSDFEEAVRARGAWTGDLLIGQAVAAQPVQPAPVEAAANDAGEAPAADQAPDQAQAPLAAWPTLSVALVDSERFTVEASTVMRVIARNPEEASQLAHVMLNEIQCDEQSMLDMVRGLYAPTRSDASTIDRNSLRPQVDHNPQPVERPR